MIKNLNENHNTYKAKPKFHVTIKSNPKFIIHTTHRIQVDKHKYINNEHETYSTISNSSTTRKSKNIKT